jgi:hypothetical protein
MKCESEMEEPEIRHHGGASTLKTNTEASFIWSEYKYSHGKHGPTHKKNSFCTWVSQTGQWKVLRIELRSH